MVLFPADRLKERFDFITITLKSGNILGSGIQGRQDSGVTSRNSYVKNGRGTQKT